MIGYIFDKDYQEARSKYKDADKKRDKLLSYQKDLMDDGSAVSSINKSIDYIVDDFTKAVISSGIRSRVTSKLDALKEPYQSSDGYLCAASEAIGDECDYLLRKMNCASDDMEKIKNS